MAYFANLAPEVKRGIAQRVREIVDGEDFSLVLSVDPISEAMSHLKLVAPFLNNPNDETPMGYIPDEVKLRSLYGELKSANFF